MSEGTTHSSTQAKGTELCSAAAATNAEIRSHFDEDDADETPSQADITSIDLNALVRASTVPRPLTVSSTPPLMPLSQVSSARVGTEVPLSVLYSRNILYNILYGDLRQTCLPRLLGFLTWKDLLSLERVARWCNVAALSKASTSIKRVPSAGYLAYHHQATSNATGEAKAMTEDAYESFILASCGYDSVKAPDTKENAGADLTNFTIRELHLQQRQEESHAFICSSPRNTCSVALDIGMNRLALVNDHFEHAWCVHFATRWPDLVEVASLVRLVAARREPIHASYFDSPHSGAHGDEHRIVVASPQHAMPTEGETNNSSEARNMSHGTVVFDAISEEDTHDHDRYPKSTEEVSLPEEDVLSARSSKLKARHTTWYISTLASWRSLFRAMHEAEADLERSLRLPRSFVPPGTHFLETGNGQSDATGRPSKRQDNKGPAQSSHGEPTHSGQTVFLSPSAKTASDRFHEDIFRELYGMLSEKVTTGVQPSRTSFDPRMGSTPEAQARRLALSEIQIQREALLSLKAWARPQCRTILMEEVNRLEDALCMSTTDEVEAKEVQIYELQGLDSSPAAGPDKTKAASRNKSIRCVQLARRRAMASHLSPIQLLDALLAHLTKINKSERIPSAPIQSALVSLTVKLTTLWMRAGGNLTFEQASFAAVRAGVSHAHMIMSLPSYAKFALREWLIQQTRVRLSRDIPLTCAPPALLLSGHGRVYSKKKMALGTVFTVSPMSGSLVTPASTHGLPSNDSRPPAALAVLPLCVCRTLTFVVRRIASDFASTLLRNRCQSSVSSDVYQLTEFHTHRLHHSPPHLSSNFLYRSTC